MSLKDRIQKRTEKIGEKHAEDFSNNGIQKKKTRLRDGFVTMSVDLEKTDKRKLNIIAVMQGKKIRDITEQALREFLDKYDETGKFKETKKKPWE